jgi:glycerol kinase
VWRLTGGAAHITDATNASRTLLFDIHRGVWDEDLLRLFRVPAAMLPEVRDCADDFGIASPDHLGAAVPILGIAGDQQAAAIGQACFTPGMMKATYGTGCFALVNTGSIAAASRSRLLTTIAYQLDGERSYALEGAIFVAGAAVQWLRDGIGVIGNASETDALAAAADAAQDVILVPAFVGLGAPHWRAEARGALFGLTRATGPAELARAALQAVAYQTRDLLDAVCLDFPGATQTVLRVDGGMAASDWTMQFLADMLDAPVDRPVVRETTALGAAWLAGHRAALLPDQTGFSRLWQRERRFLPAMSGAERERRLASWRRAVQATIASSGCA